MIYLNSFFSIRFSLFPLLITKFILKTPILLAPRGEFSAGALAIRSIRKKLYLCLLHPLYRHVVFHATGDVEAKDIQVFFPHVVFKIIPNFFESSYLIKSKTRNKKLGELKIIFLSRIAKKKNLDGILKLLNYYPLSVHFDIYGPLEDETYWRYCQKLIQALPEQVKVNYKGSVEHSAVAETFSQYDLFIFLTHGENFGHVILEALAAGCPVILSKATPWKTIEQMGAGWCFAIDDFKGVAEKLKQLQSFDQAQYQQLINNAKAYAKQYTSEFSDSETSQNLFKL